MQDNAQQTLDLHKMQLVAGLGAVAESLRNTATLAENFVNYLQQTSFVPQSQATSSSNASSNFPLGMFPMFGQLFGGGMALANGYQQQAAHAASPVEAKHEEAEGDGKKRKRGRAGADEKDKEKKGKKAKDLFAPKRPPSAYILFQNEIRRAMQIKYPNLAYSEILGKVSEKWSTLAPEQKAVYETVTKAAKEQYNLRKKVYEDAVNSGMSNEEAHKLAETKHPDPVAIDVPAPAKKDTDDSEEGSELASPAAPAAESDSDSESEAADAKAKDEDSSELDSEEDEEAPKAPSTKKQKVQEQAVSKSKPSPAMKEKEKENKKKDKESKKKDKKSKKDD